jgi:hypothetical protein
MSIIGVRLIIFNVDRQIGPVSKIFLGRYATPCLVLPSYLGQLLYSPIDLETHIVEPQLALIDIADLLHKDFGAASLQQLCNQPNNLTHILSYRGKYNSAVNCDAKGIFVDTKSGRKHISLDQYLQRASSEKTAAVITLADEVQILLIRLILFCNKLIFCYILYR